MRLLSEILTDESASVRQMVAALIHEDPSCGADIIQAVLDGEAYEVGDEDDTELDFTSVDLSDIGCVEIDLLRVHCNIDVVFAIEHRVSAYLLNHHWYPYWEFHDNIGFDAEFSNDPSAKDKLLEHATSWFQYHSAYGSITLSGCLVPSPWFTRMALAQFSGSVVHSYRHTYEVARLRSEEDLSPERELEITEAASEHWQRVTTNSDHGTAQDIFSVRSTDNEVTMWAIACRATCADTGEPISPDDLPHLRLVCIYLSQVTEPDEPTLDDVLAKINASARQ